MGPPVELRAKLDELQADNERLRSQLKELQAAVPFDEEATEEVASLKEEAQSQQSTIDALKKEPNRPSLPSAKFKNSMLTSSRWSTRCSET